MIETSRLILRRFAAWDAQAMYDNWASDPEVTKYLTWPPHSGPEVSAMVLESWIAGYDKMDFYQWAIVPKVEGKPVGSISVVRMDDKAGICEIGYCIGSLWWHQGITSEALAAVMTFLFEEVGADRVEAKHDPNNPNSGAVMRKCGMEYVGMFLQADRNNQGICDVCVYAMTKKDRLK